MTANQSTKPLLPEGARSLLLGLIALAILIGFILIYAEVFWCATHKDGVFLSLACPPKLDDQQLLSISTGLTGLVGGVIAVALAQQQGPEAPGGGTSGGGPSGGRVPEGPASEGQAFGSQAPEGQAGGDGEGGSSGWFSWRSELGWKGLLVFLYTVSYMVLGLVAVLIWVSQGEDAPDTVQALASVSLGLLIPIVRSYFIPGE